MREELEKKIKKYKTRILLTGLGLATSLILTVLFLKLNDRTAWGFAAASLMFTHEIIQAARRIRRAKRQMQEEEA